MKMYKCTDCGNVFEDGEEQVWEEDMGEFWGRPCSKEFRGCPICKGNYEEIKPCVICGSYNHNIEDEFCDNCKKYLKNKFVNLIETNFNEKERKLLNELYDGEPI